METILLSTGKTMYTMRKHLRGFGVAICVLLIPWLTVVCQSMPDPLNELFKKAQAYEAAYNDEAALSEYLAILGIQEDNLQALIRASQKKNRAGPRSRLKSGQIKQE